MGSQVHAAGSPRRRRHRFCWQCRRLVADATGSPERRLPASLPQRLARPRRTRPRDKRRVNSRPRRCPRSRRAGASPDGVEPHRTALLGSRRSSSTSRRSRPAGLAAYGIVPVPRWRSHRRRKPGRCLLLDERRQAPGGLGLRSTRSPASRGQAATDHPPGKDLTPGRDTSSSAQLKGARSRRPKKTWSRASSKSCPRRKVNASRSTWPGLHGGL